MLRILIAVAQEPSVEGTRSLAEAAGLAHNGDLHDRVNDAESLGLLKVVRGASHWSEERTSPNRYALTPAGQAALPKQVQSAHGIDAFQMGDDRWQERGGYGLLGWLLATSVDEPTLITKQDAATLWGITVKNAGERMKRLAAKDGGLLVAMDDGQWLVNPDCWEPTTTNPNRRRSMDAQRKVLVDRIDQIDQGVQAMAAYLEADLSDRPHRLTDRTEAVITDLLHGQRSHHERDETQPAGRPAEVQGSVFEDPSASQGPQGLSMLEALRVLRARGARLEPQAC